METHVVNPDQTAHIWFLCIYCLDYKCTPADDKAYGICQEYFVGVKYVDLKMKFNEKLDPCGSNYMNLDM